MSSISCPHWFPASGDKPHYCTYIQVPGLLDAFYPGARTADEKLLCSFFYASILWWTVQERDLDTLARLPPGPMSLERYQDALKRLERCLALDAILRHQGLLARSTLIRRTPDIRFHWAALRPDALPSFAHVRSLTQRLMDARPQLDTRDTRLTGAVTRADLLARWDDHLQAHGEHLSTIGDLVDGILDMMQARTVGASIPFEDVVPATALAALGQASLRRHHPQALDPSSPSSDELTFITAHQTFEVWFPTVSALIQEVVAQLTARPARVVDAEGGVRRLAAVFGLFREMIRVPQTMTAADYLAFRPQLEGGSGAESIAFRAIEIAVGLRDPRYRSGLERMGLLTPDLARLWEAVSLNEAVLDVLRARRLVDAGDGSERVARVLGDVMRPTGTPHPHADVQSLVEACIDVEQQVEAWRTTHLAMVDRMIGYNRPSLGIGGQEAAARGVTPPGDGQERDGKPYLLKTLTYQRLFPLLWDARNYMREGRASSRSREEGG